MYLRQTDLLAWCFIALLVAASAMSMLSATPLPTDDHFIYQSFIEALARGKLDLTIPGFHGMNIVAVPWYWITRSPIAQIEFQMLSGMLLPLFAFLAARHLFRSTWHGIVFASIIAMMPFLSASALRGWMVATYHLLVLLTIALAAGRSRWAWIPFGLSVISLPFAIALLPLLIAYAPGEKGKWWIRYRHVLYGLAIPTVYVLLQIFQAGRIQVGVHEEFSAASVWQGPFGILRNAAHALQVLFSVHNFYFPDPVKTAQGNLMHTSPVLILLGIFAFLAHRTYLPDRRVHVSLVLGAIIGLGLSIVVDHIDHFYMETGILFLLLAALPVLAKEPLWIPLALATLHFQFLYFFLQFRSAFALHPILFFAPAVAIDAAFLLWCVFHLQDILERALALFPDREKHLLQRFAGHHFVRKHTAQLLKFSVCGGLGMGIDLLSLSLFVEFGGVPERFAFLLSSILGATFVFFANKFFTFANRERSYASQGFKFAMVYGVAIILNAAVSNLLHWIGLQYLLAKLTAIAVIALWNYTLSHGFIFRKREKVEEVVF